MNLRSFVRERALAAMRRILESMRPRIETLPFTGADLDRAVEAEHTFIAALYVSEDTQRRFLMSRASA